MGAPNLPAAFFVSPDATEREVTLADGSVHKLLFREPSAKTMRRYYFASLKPEGTGSDEFDLAVAEMIAASLVNPDGAPVLTVEQALNLKFEVQASMSRAIREGGEPGKPSKPGPKTGSGTSSRRSSVGAALLNGKRRSRAPSSSAGSSSTKSRDG